MAGVREAKAFLSSVYQRSEESSHKRPYVTLAYAQSLDGKTSGPGGKQVAFSSNESLAMSHRLRMINDGILLGVGTVLNDDPRLTARIVEPNEIPVQPQPIILDSKLRFPLRSNLILSASQGGGKYPWIFCAPDYPPQRRQALEAAGVQIFVVSSQGDKLSIPEILRKTEELGIRKLMVEGGSNVIREFLASGYIDLCVITLAPVYIGGTGASSVVDGDNRPLSKLSDIRYHQFGIDMVVVGYASPTSHVGSVHGDSQNQFQQAAYPPSGTHPSSQQPYGGSIAPSSGYPPSHGSGYPPSNNSGYPPSNNSGYPPSNNSAYPPSNSSGYPPTSPTSHYPPTSPSGGYPPQASQTGGYPQRPQGGVYPPKLEAGPPLPPRAGTNISPQQGYPPKTTSPVQSVPGRVSSPQGYSSTHGSIYPPQGSSGYPPQGNSGYPSAVSGPPKRDAGYPGGSGYPPQGGSVYPPQAGSGPPKKDVGYPPQGGSGYPPQGGSVYPPQAGSGPPKKDVGYPPQGGSGYPPQGGSGYPPQGASVYPPQVGSGPPKKDVGYPPQGGSGYPPQGNSGYPPQGSSGYPPQGNSGYPPNKTPSNQSPPLRVSSPPQGAGYSPSDTSYPSRNPTVPYPPSSK